MVLAGFSPVYLIVRRDIYSVHIILLNWSGFLSLLAEGEKVKKRLGNKGEEIAARYLEDKGYRILQRNYYCRSGEIDIICLHARTLVFVEVKTRTSTVFGSPEEAITRSKREHIRRAALDYLDRTSQSFKDMRFDVIGIMVETDNFTINHIKGAF